MIRPVPKVLTLLSPALLAVVASAAAPRADAFVFGCYYPGESCVNRTANVFPYYFSGAIDNASSASEMAPRFPTQNR